MTTCKYCGRLFRQNKTNRIQYCYKHRGYQKKVLRFGICVDCGREFSVAATEQNRVRCDKCQENYRRKYKHDYYLKQKNKN